MSALKAAGISIRATDCFLFRPWMRPVVAARENAVIAFNVSVARTEGAGHSARKKNVHAI